jgi:hypothetical protein
MLDIWINADLKSNIRHIHKCLCTSDTLLNEPVTYDCKKQKNSQPVNP